MPHPFDPQDFPVNEERRFKPTKTFLLKGSIHFKHTAKIVNVTGRTRRGLLRSGAFHPGLFADASRAADEAIENSGPDYEVSSCGNMMRTIKTMTDARSGDKLCSLNMTFVTFGSSTIRFPRGSEHCRHEIELFAVRPEDKEARHEAFIRHSIPYFWDLTEGPEAVLYKALNQERVEVARAAAYGFNKDVILATDGDELDDVVGLASCIIFLNGRDAMDS